MENNDRIICDRPVAVIILNWNGRALMEKYLPSVVAHTDPEIGRVIVADNGSDDDSVAMLRERFPEVELLPFDRNHGFAEGYNLAIGLVESKYTLLLNSDVEVRDNWLRPLYDHMERCPRCGACQPKIRSLLEPEKFEYAGAAGGFLDLNGYPYCRGRLFGDVETDCGQYDDPSGSSPVFWASGAALMVRREVYLSTGGLDASFFAHMEEIDLCWRIRLAGYGVDVVTGSAVYHLGGGSLPASNPRKTYLNFRNNLLMMDKNLPDNCRRRVLFRRRLLDAVAWLKFVATFDFGNAAAVLRAHRDYRHMARSIERTAVSLNLLEEDPCAGVDILIQYYLLRRRRFSDLSFPK
ncbi:MAG: glycosyltransferase family 2 protein [Clostridium sp.]|nr:glycosyltransferase family 2 protein [Clostridium sp.]